MHDNRIGARLCSVQQSLGHEAWEAKGSGMASGFKHWLSLLLSQFSKSQNIDGDYRAIEPSAIPSVSYLAEWARERGDISEMWVYGSALDHDRWDALEDDLDVLFLVPNEKWTGDTERGIPREAPLSEQYIDYDIRVFRESDAEPWRTLALTHGLAAKENPEARETLIEHVMRHGACVWRCDDEASDPQ